MARTLVGILQILLKQDVTQKAPAINQAIQSIENQAKRLGNAAWGAGFQRQLDRLKVSPTERAAITASYDRLARDINGKIAKADLAAWRQGTLSHLALVRSGLKETAAQARAMQGVLGRAKTAAGNIAKPALVALGAYTGWYAAGIALREGFNAGGERQREYFRQDMAGLPENDKIAIAAEAQRLTIQYPSVGMTEIMEMSRTARNTMGNTAEGLAILEDMVRGLVTLQSSDGVDVGGSNMMRLIRALDNLGLNAGGEIGLANMREVMAGAIRAAQIEGGEIDVGQFFDFARRAKVAGPALSNEFLATTAAALMQDMTAQGAGTAIASAYQSLVVGSSAVASKVNLAEQRRLGLREGEGGPQGFGKLVESSLFGQNPYQWVKKYLIPALAKDGVDMDDEVAVTQAVAMISRNTMATGLLTRLVTQSPQIDRLIGMYGQAMGPEAADRARNEDPFVAGAALTTSLANFSAALGEHVMPVIVPALNSFADTINTLAAATRTGTGWQVGITTLGAVIGGIGAWKVGAAGIGGLVALTTAGPSLQTAAVMLQGAATSLGGTGAAGAAGGAASKAGWFASAATWIKGLAVAASPALLSDLTIGGPNSTAEFDAQVEEQAAIKAKMWSFIDGVVGKMDELSSLPSAYDGIELGGMANNPMMTGEFPDDQSAPWGDAVTGAEEAGRAIETSLNVTAAPQVDLASIRAALDMVERLKTALSTVGGLASGEGNRVQSQMRASFSDYGIVP